MIRQIGRLLLGHRQAKKFCRKERKHCLERFLSILLIKIIF